MLVRACSHAQTCRYLSTDPECSVTNMLGKCCAVLCFAVLCNALPCTRVCAFSGRLVSNLRQEASPHLDEARTHDTHGTHDMHVMCRHRKCLRSGTRTSGKRGPKTSRTNMCGDMRGDIRSTCRPAYSCWFQAPSAEWPHPLVRSVGDHKSHGPGPEAASPPPEALNGSTSCKTRDGPVVPALAWRSALPRPLHARLVGV